MLGCLPQTYEQVVGKRAQGGLPGGSTHWARESTCTGGSAEAKVSSISVSKMIKLRVAATGGDEVMQSVPWVGTHEHCTPDPREVPRSRNLFNAAF